MEACIWQPWSVITVNEVPVGAVFGVKSRIRVAVAPFAMVVPAMKAVMACGLGTLPVQMVVASSRMVLRRVPVLLSQT